MFNQFFHIVKVTGNNEDAWNHICLGTDYEDVIDPLDIYYYADGLVNFDQRLQKFWERMLREAAKDQFKDNEAFQQYRTFLSDKLPEDLIKKILWENSQWFLEKHFVEV
ncbi:MAG: hypothetical protein IPL46_01925 [Saprospiraceae bacterium]|nr:hypothetical protein [Saprospiraceae bacterium]